MDMEDVIYLLCLLACIVLGLYTRKIKDESQRKLLTTSFGVLVVFVVSGYHILHCFVSFLLGATALILVHPSKCHLVGFAIMFGYLVFFRLVGRFGLPDAPGPTNMIQMILTLKVSGVLFEKNAAYKKICERNKEITERNAPSTSQNKDTANSGKLIELSDYDIELQSIGVVDLFHYTFNYIGVLTGPYYRYRTYRDYFETPFKNYSPNAEVTLSKLKYAAFYCSLYLLTNYLWPLNYALSDEFYEERSLLYRLMYIWPTFFIFRMRMYTGLTLSECVCTCAGFGAYPEESDVTNGEGPKGQYLHFKRNPEKQKYNFTTIVNLRAYEVESCWTFREAMKHWNICIQYWLAVNVYKLFPSKKYRMFATLLVSSFWHGFWPGHYFCIMGAPIYVPIEDIWNKLIRKNATGTKRHIIDVVFWVFKFFSFSYLGTAFVLLTFDRIWTYYTSVYHLGYLAWIVLVVVGIFLTQQNKSSERQERKNNEIASSGEISVNKQKAQ